MNCEIKTKILELKRPNGGWIVSEDDVKYDDNVIPLTEEEWTDGEAEIANLSYRDKRKPLYPPLTEFADSYVHLQNGNPAPMASYIEKCNAVKVQFPKP